MTELYRAGEPKSLGHIDTIQKDFRNQIDALTDTVRQLGGNPTLPADPLSAPYVLYVDSYIGSDTFVSGDYNASLDDGTFDSKMKRISLQRLECGYTQSRPFRSLSRAVIEAGIITSRDYLDLKPAPCGDLVTIVVASGVHTLLNSPGDASAVAEWTDGYEPTDAELTAFSGSTGGIILPRGCSVVSLDLRKTIVRPSYVPSPADEAADLSNRSAMFLVTGGCYLYGFTIMDKEGLAESHHLLSGFAFAGKTELDSFYSKIRKAFDGTGATGNIDSALAVTRTSEYFIVGPTPRTPTEPTDTVRSSSPYVYNISLRSEYGLSGMIADGSKSDGFKSMVVAQYTGVSVQRDLRAWEKYAAGNWGSFTDYNDLINQDPDNVRFKPEWRSFHVRTRNESVIQEVSVFAIGQAIHHLAESGSQITITNSNSNFGGVSALATGFQSEAAPGDTPWSIELVRRAVDPLEKTSNIKRIFLGQLESTQSNTATTLDLTVDLTVSTSDPTQPDLLVRDDYSLEENDYIWVENPGGPDYRAQLAATPWTSSAADKIQIKTAVTTDNKSGNVNPDDADADDNVFTDLEGKRVYIRRLRDVRSVKERRYAIINSGGINKVRLPVRDYVIQPILGGDWALQLQAVAGAERATEVSNGALVELRYSKRPDADTDFDSGVYYRKADVVRRENKHWFSTRNNYGPWDPDGWSETYVHMEEEYAPEGYFSNAQPIITFNKDTAQDEDSLLLGNALSDTLVQAQLRSGVDYQGLFYLLLNLGYTRSQAYTFLDPQASDSVDADVSSNNWNVDFRRPTNIRLFGHAYEWAGYNNYSKALPQYQGELSANNKFTFYFTNQDGGKVYASGFNEEGLAVTPRGLEDVTTGQVLGLEEIGNPDRDISFPTVFENLKVTDTLDIEGAEVIGLQTGLTTRVGGGEIASIQEIESATKANSDADLNKPQPTNFLTPEGLKYWARWANVVTKRPGIQVLYVVPDNAVDGGTYNFNGVSATLSLPPDRDASEEPPFRAEIATTFSRAVSYSNDNYSTEETVQYRLANGPYWSISLIFNHIAQIVGATKQFPTANVLSDFNTPVKPTTDVKALMDGMDMPVFATRTNLGISSSVSRCNGRALPLQLRMNEGGSINGVAWMGAEETFSDTTNFPDSIFSVLGAYRGSGSVAEAIDDYLASSAVPATYIFDRYTSVPSVRVTNSNVSISNTIFGATAPGVGSIGYRGINPIVYTVEKCNISFAGIYLLGNITASGFPKASAKGITVSNAVTGTRHSDELVGGISSTAKAVELGVYFLGNKGINKVPGTSVFERDIDVNCIHLLDNNGRYALMSNRDATNGTRGPCFRRIIGQLPAGSKLYTGGYSSYRRGFTVGGHQHGFAGVFGTVSGTDGPIGIEDGVQQLSLQRNASYSNSVWQQARTGTMLTTNISPTVAPGTDEQAYDVSSNNVLNIRSSIWYQGVDVTNGQVVGGFLTSGRFYG